MRPTLALLALLVAAPSVADAGFIGTTLNASYEFPNSGTNYPLTTYTPSSFVVGPGQETVGNIEGVTSFGVDFTNTTLSLNLTTTLGGPTFGNGGNFNGPVFSLAGPGSLNILAATVDPSTTLVGFDNSRVSFTSDQVRINWEGLSYHTGSSVVIDFTFSGAAVPEPASLGMVGMGLVATSGAAIRRRRWARQI